MGGDRLGLYISEYNVPYKLKLFRLTCVLGRINADFN